MAKKVVYVLPGDLLEIRVCDPVFEEGANAYAWKLGMTQRRIVLSVDGASEITVPPMGLDVFCGLTRTNRTQMLPTPTPADRA